MYTGHFEFLILTHTVRSNHCSFRCKIICKFSFIFQIRAEETYKCIEGQGLNRPTHYSYRPNICIKGLNTNP